MQDSRRKPPLPRGNWTQVTLTWSTVVCTTLVILVGLFWVMVFGDSFHRFEHQRLGTAQRFTQASPMAVVQYLQNYFRSNDVHLMHHPLFSYRERQHYQDIKHLLRTLQTMWRWTLVFGIGSLSVLAFRQRYNVRWPLALAVVVCRHTALLLISVAALGALCLTSFDTHFVQLHHVLFATDSWLLPPYAATVQIFPVQYFFDFALVYMALVLSAAAGLGIMAWGTRRHTPTHLLPSALGTAYNDKPQYV